MSRRNRITRPEDRRPDRIIRQQIECGDHDSARNLMNEVIPLALNQPEPLRSRSLAMLVESQVKVRDTAGAKKVTNEIRDYPGLEKYRALNSLADWYEKAGDNAASRALLRKALGCMETKATDDEVPHGQEGRLSGFVLSLPLC